MTRIAFTADLHVDAYGSRIDPATALNARLLDYLSTLRWVSVQAMERSCDALVVAGDFTERRHPAPWLVSKIADALEEGPEELVLVRGNHDGEIAGGSIVTVLGNATGHDRAFARPGIAWIRRTALACVPYLDRHWLRAQPGFETVPDAEVFRILGEQFLAIASGLYAEAYREHPDAEGVVLVCHQGLAGGLMSDAQAAFLGDLSLVVDTRALASIGFEAIVAGHFHKHQVIPAEVPVIYPGSIERVDFGEADQPKGFIVADVDRGRFEWEFVETPARRFVTLQGAPAIENAELGLTNIDGFVQDVRDAIVRCVDVPPEADVAEVRRTLGAAGAFEIAEIRRRPVEAPESNGGLSESLSGEQALEAYFADDPDRDALVSHGREILTEVGS